MGAYPYRDAAIEGEKLAVAAGIVPSAVRELVQQLPTMGFRNVEGDLINDKGETIEEYIASLHKTKPHYWLSDSVVDDAEAAFGAHPTLKARGEFMKSFGETIYKNTASQWGADASLRPGKRPGTANDDGGNSAAAPSKNPWSNSFPKENREAAIVRFITAFGSAKAESMAKSAGVNIAGGPLAKR